MKTCVPAMTAPCTTHAKPMHHPAAAHGAECVCMRMRWGLWQLHISPGQGNQQPRASHCVVVTTVCVCMCAAHWL